MVALLRLWEKLDKLLMTPLSCFIYELMNRLLGIVFQGIACLWNFPAAVFLICLFCLACNRNELHKEGGWKVRDLFGLYFELCFYCKCKQLWASHIFNWDAALFSMYTDHFTVPWLQDIVHDGLCRYLRSRSAKYYSKEKNSMRIFMEMSLLYSPK